MGDSVLLKIEAPFFGCACVVYHYDVQKQSYAFVMVKSNVCFLKISRHTFFGLLSMAYR